MGRAFVRMLGYLQEMAEVAARIAAGVAAVDDAVTINEDTPHTFAATGTGFSSTAPYTQNTGLQYTTDGGTAHYVTCAFNGTAYRLIETDATETTFSLPATLKMVTPWVLRPITEIPPSSWE